MRGLQNQALANERGTLYVDAIFDTITIHNPIKLVYRCRTPPYLTCIFRKKTKHFWHVFNILQIYLTVAVLGLFVLQRYMYWYWCTFIIITTVVTSMQYNMYHKRPLDAQNALPIPMPEGGRSERPKAGNRPPQGMGIAGPFWRALSHRRGHNGS